MRRHSSGYDLLFFTAILATVIALGPQLAHLFELPAKMGLSRTTYFTVQRIYSGGALFAAAILVQFVTLMLLAMRSRGEHYVFRPVLAALLCLVAAQFLFWTVTFPANSATANWTMAPPDWRSLRDGWELSHAGAALFQLLGLCFLIWALFARARAGGR